MVTRYIRYLLCLLFLFPFYLLFTKAKIWLEISVWLLLVVIPLIGLLLRKTWFFYYIYILIPITLPLVISVMWFISLFGDQAYSVLAIIGILWPVLLYFGAIISLTVILHIKQGAERRDPC